ncbi:hypothetical protein SK128_025862, partial [Halocaridina rubra]
GHRGRGVEAAHWYLPDTATPKVTHLQIPNPSKMSGWNRLPHLSLQYYTTIPLTKVEYQLHRGGNFSN